jgi:hypothetical protein
MKAEAVPVLGVLEYVVNLRRLFFPNSHKRSYPMNFIGIDLHKQTISICVVN